MHTPGFTRRWFLTTNGGDSWREASFPRPTEGNPHDLFFLDRQHGWLVLWNGSRDGAESTLLESTDGGTTWAVSRVSARVGAKRVVNAVRFLSEDVGFVFVGPSARSEDSGTPASTGNAAVLWTTDRGHTWHLRALPVAVQSCEVAGNEIWCSSGMDLVKIRATR